MKTRAILALLLGSLILAPLALAGDTFEMPAAVAELMPAEATLVMAVSSVNEMVDRWVAIQQAMDSQQVMTREDVLTTLDQMVPGFTTEVDLARPIFGAAGLPDMMGGGMPPLLLMLPMRNSADDSLRIQQSFGSQIRAGDYVALATSPLLQPAAGVPAISSHLPAGVISASLDLARIVSNFRPFIEMGLAGIPIRDENAATPDDAGMSADEAAALQNALRDAMDAVTRLDLAFGHDGDQISMHAGLGVLPGSALDPGPQPDFARAQALTAALPTDADFLQVIALDQTRVFDAFRDYYLLSMRNSLGGMNDQQAERYGAWVEDYIAAMDLWANPMAAALKVVDDKMTVHAIMAVDDPQAELKRVSELFAGMNDLDIGYEMTRAKDKKFAGVKFQVWDVDFDLTKFEAVMPDAHGPAMSGTDRMQAEQLVAILQRVMPRVYFGADKDRLYLAADGDTETLAAMVKEAGRGGRPVASVAAIAKQAGPGCQQVITGDMLAIINWVTDLVAEMNEEEHAVFSQNPIPFAADFVIDGSDFGFDMAMDLPALGRLIQAAEQLED